MTTFGNIDKTLEPKKHLPCQRLWQNDPRTITDVCAREWKIVSECVYVCVCLQQDCRQIKKVEKRNPVQSASNLYPTRKNNNNNKADSRTSCIKNASSQLQLNFDSFSGKGVSWNHFYTLHHHYYFELHFTTCLNALPNFHKDRLKNLVFLSPSLCTKRYILFRQLLHRIASVKTPLIYNKQ